MSRCLICNQPLRSATAAERTRIPPQIRARGLPVTVCPQCRKLFWPGGHEQRMQQVLVRFDRTFSRHRTPGDPAADPAAGP
jgi:uncharacterized protein with PIN domain